MIRVWILLLLLIPTSCLAGPPPWCVRVFCHKDNDGIVDFTGSGVLIETDLVVTNYHVIRGKKTFQVMFPDWESVDGTVVKYDKDVDLALIKIPESYRNTAPVGKLVRQGLIVKGHGYGQGIYKNGVGVVTSFAGTLTNPFCFFYISGHQARPGDSGGPVANTSGKVIGIASGAGPDTTLAIKFEEVEKLVAAYKKEKK